MGFKLGSAKREIRTPKKTPIFKRLRDGVAGEANKDGTINIDPSIPVGSPEYTRVMKHEQQHLRDMESGRADYGESHVEWEGNIYFRHNVNGQAFIDGPAGRLPEGHPEHPWEQSAIIAEDMPAQDDVKGDGGRGFKMGESPYKFSIGKLALGGLAGGIAEKFLKRKDDGFDDEAEMQQGEGAAISEFEEKKKWKDMNKQEKRNRLGEMGKMTALGGVGALGNKLFKR